MTGPNPVWERARREGKKVLVIHPSANNRARVGGLALLTGQVLVDEQRWCPASQAYLVDPAELLSVDLTGTHWDWWSHTCILWDENRWWYDAQYHAVVYHIFMWLAWMVMQLPTVE